MIIENGRPKTDAGRLKKEIRSYDLLQSLGIEFTRADHEAAMTMEACEEIDAAMGVKMCKNLFLTNRQQTAFYLLLIPGDKQFKTKDVSSQIGSARLSFGSAELMEELLDITPGSLSILGLMNDLDRDVTLLIDRELCDAEYFGCHPCINTSTVKFKTSDLFEKLIYALKHTPTFVDLPRSDEQ